MAPAHNPTVFVIDDERFLLIKSVPLVLARRYWHN